MGFQWDRFAELLGQGVQRTGQETAGAMRQEYARGQEQKGRLDILAKEDENAIKRMGIEHGFREEEENLRARLNKDQFEFEEDFKRRAEIAEQRRQKLLADHLNDEGFVAQQVFYRTVGGRPDIADAMQDMVTRSFQGQTPTAKDKELIKSMSTGARQALAAKWREIEIQNVELDNRRALSEYYRRETARAGGKGSDTYSDIITGLEDSWKIRSMISKDSDTLLTNDAHIVGVKKLGEYYAMGAKKGWSEEEIKRQFETNEPSIAAAYFTIERELLDRQKSLSGIDASIALKMAKLQAMEDAELAKSPELQKKVEEMKAHLKKLADEEEAKRKAAEEASQPKKQRGVLYPGEGKKIKYRGMTPEQEAEEMEDRPALENFIKGIGPKPSKSSVARRFGIETPEDIWVFSNREDYEALQRGEQMLLPGSFIFDNIKQELWLVTPEGELVDVTDSNKEAVKRSKKR